MPALTRKVQVLLTEERHRALIRLAAAQGKPVSALLRDEVVDHLLKEARRSARRKAFEEITAMDLPVADWPEVEAQLEQAHGGARGRR
jgi:16S rRNA U516 pseudouridylate synthase RsuA-like enzyme